MKGYRLLQGITEAVSLLFKEKCPVGRRKGDHHSLTTGRSCKERFINSSPISGIVLCLYNNNLNWRIYTGKFHYSIDSFQEKHKSGSVVYTSFVLRNSVCVDRVYHKIVCKLKKKKFKYYYTKMWMFNIFRSIAVKITMADFPVMNVSKYLI